VCVRERKREFCAGRREIERERERERERETERETSMLSTRMLKMRHSPPGLNCLC